MAIEIRPADFNQIGILSKIEALSFGKEAYTRQHLSYLLKDPCTIALVALNDSAPIGFIIVRLELEKGSCFGHIITIDVLDSWRRKGIGFKLLNMAEKLVEKLNVAEMHLEVREDNIAAVSLYDKAGYETIGMLENYYEGIDGLYMKKTLPHKTGQL